MKTTFYYKNGQILKNRQFLFEDINISVFRIIYENLWLNSTVLDYKEFIKHQKFSSDLLKMQLQTLPGWKKLSNLVTCELSYRVQCLCVLLHPVNILPPVSKQRDTEL